MPNFANFDPVKDLKKNDPLAFEFMSALADISIKRPVSNSFEQQYNTAMESILKMIDEKYRINIDVYDNNDVETTYQCSSLLPAFKKANVSENFQPKNVTEKFVASLIRSRNYWKNQPRLPDETGANLAVWDFCKTMDAVTMDQNWYPALFKKRSPSQIAHVFHELIASFENAAKKKLTAVR